MWTGADNVFDLSAQHLYILFYGRRANSLTTAWWEAVYLTEETFPSSVSSSGLRLWTDCVSAVSLPWCHVNINNGCRESHYSNSGMPSRLLCSCKPGGNEWLMLATHQATTQSIFKVTYTFTARIKAKEIWSTLLWFTLTCFKMVLVLLGITINQTFFTFSQVFGDHIVQHINKFSTNKCSLSYRKSKTSVFGCCWSFLSILSCWFSFLCGWLLPNQWCCSSNS